ncbi:unnamed protein product [Rotaria sordida]|uniref:Uncharacterized protein n=1 Tax=Rotaria sordida TaxID=392033 RepID=A0A813Q085_9BILA|nr:unnamed protein product [Rotaria sordida]
MPVSDSSIFNQDQLISNLQLLNNIGRLLEIDSSQIDNGEIFLTKLRKLQNIYYITQNRLDTFDIILPTIQQNYIEMTNLAKILHEKQQKIINCQNEKFDEYESTRMMTMAEMKFIENKLQALDINTKPPVTHTQIEKLQQDVDNSRCEYEILKQQIAHWMPCDEPTIDSLTNKVESVRDELRSIEDEISIILDMRHNQQYHRRQHSTKLNSNDYDLCATGGDDDQFSSNIPYRMINTNMDSVVDYLSDDESDSEMPAGYNLDIPNPVREVIRQMLDNYMNDDKSNTEIEFPSSLFCHERIFVRQQAQQRNLICRTLGRGASRVIAVSKSTNESILNNNNDSNKQITFSLNNLQLIHDINIYLQSCPISAEDNDLLQAKIQKTPSSLNDWYYCTLLRSGNPIAKISDIKSRIPDQKFLSPEHFIRLLPIDKSSTRDNLLHLIESNKMIFLSGPPGIGKSIRICQYLNDDHFDKQWPIRILHSCTNSLAAYALSTILSSFNQSIDCFTFDNMSLIAESTSLITITTHEFLLHTLISGDYLLKSSITHLIIDDVHKRSHTLDMLLAYLKDTQHKFRYLKIILIQTTIPFDTLVKYFGNIATHTIDMNGIMNEKIEEIFLDQILFDIQQIDQKKCLSIANYGMQLLDHWCHLAEQSSIHHQISSLIICDSCQNIYSLLEQNMTADEKYLSNLIGRCFINGLIEDFELMMNFIIQYPNKCNYQHPLTLVTPLMCISMWSIKTFIERLLLIDGLLINLRAVNNFSAIDFARKFATNETIDLLESNLTHDPLVLEQLLSLTDNNSNSIASIALMKYYLQTRKFDDIIDYELILSIVKRVCQIRSGHILVFLPSLDEISTMADLVLNTNFSNEFQIEVHTILNSTSWSLMNNDCLRLLILCDASCETGVPFRNISCVIDTGITLEKCYHTTTSKFLPKYNWISQTSATERKHRANIEEGGICYRLYPHYLFNEKINENINAEMARQPLLENIMQAKLFAWTNCSVAEFMLKLPFPPPFAIVRAGISQLKSLDLFDKWEDLVELGAYCLALPIVELPYAMMIVYAHLFKCLQPILIIVSTLITGDPFQSKSNIRCSSEFKQRLASNKNSDHFVFYQLYLQWEQSIDKKQFCINHNIKYFRMKQIDCFKKSIIDFLRNINFSNFFYSNNNENIDLNENSSCWPLIQAILVRCLPQNLLIYDQQWLSNRNELVIFDQSSILNNIQWNEQEKIRYVICDDLIRSTKGLFLGKYCTLIEDIVLLFFGTINDTLKLNDYQIILTDNNNNLFKLRTKLNACIKRKLQSLGCDNDTTNDYHSFDLLVQIFSNIK